MLVDPALGDPAEVLGQVLGRTAHQAGKWDDGNDGGVDVSEDGGGTWTNRSAGPGLISETG